jgi:hypothetical protein
MMGDCRRGRHSTRAECLEERPPTSLVQEDPDLVLPSCHDQDRASSSRRRSPGGVAASRAILLRRAQDPVVAKLDAAHYDDEELTDEDLDEVCAARSDPGVPWVASRGGAGRWLSLADGGSRSAPPRWSRCASWVAEAEVAVGP